jgi:hypothetical protein
MHTPGDQDDYLGDEDESIFWNHEISIIVTSILTVRTVFRRKLFK